MNKVQIREKVGMGSATLARLSKNEEVSMNVLGRICSELDCDLADIVEYIKTDYDIFI